MNKKNIKGVLVASAITAICITALNSTVSAATYDFTNTNTGKVWLASEWKNDDSIKNQLIDDIINNPDVSFKYEATNGGFYDYSKLRSLVTEGIANGMSKTEAYNYALSFSPMLFTK